MLGNLGENMRRNGKKVLRVFNEKTLHVSELSTINYIVTSTEAYWWIQEMMIDEDKWNQKAKRDGEQQNCVEIEHELHWKCLKTRSRDVCPEKNWPTEAKKKYKNKMKMVLKKNAVHTYSKNISWYL